MPKSGAVSVSYVFVQIVMTADANHDVIRDLTSWLARKYPNNEGGSFQYRIQLDEGYQPRLAFVVRKPYNPRRVAKKTEKKLDELLAAKS